MPIRDGGYSDARKGYRCRLFTEYARDGGQWPKLPASHRINIPPSNVTSFSIEFFSLSLYLASDHLASDKAQQARLLDPELS